MVRAEQVGMSSVQPMASHSEDEQREIYAIMQEALKAEVDLTRTTMKEIVDGYRNGKKTWAEIKDLPRDSGLPLNSFIPSEPSESKSEEPKNRNDEVRREHDPISAEADRMDEDEKRWEESQREKEEETEEPEPHGEEEEVEESHKTEKKESNEEEKKFKKSEEIKELLEKLGVEVSEIYEFHSKEEAENMMMYYRDAINVLVDEVRSIGKRYELKEQKDIIIQEVKAIVEEE